MNPTPALNLDRLNFGPILQAAQAALMPAQRFLALEHEGKVGLLGADLYLRFGEELVTLRKLLEGARCLESGLSFFSSDERRLTAYRALQDLGRVVVAAHLSSALAGGRPVDMEAFVRRLVVTVEVLEEACGAALSGPSPAAPQPTGADQGSGQKPDGPEGGCWLWWRGKRHDVPKGVVYLLLAYMWDRDSASYDALVGPVFELDVAPATVRARATDVNKELKRNGIPWRLKTDSVSRQLTKHPAS
jgi:hypothetical protein